MKILLLLLSLTFIGSINAQSDATKEETISWIEKFASKFMENYYVESWKDETCEVELTINNNIISREISYEEDGKTQHLIYKVAIENVKKISLNKIDSHYEIFLTTTSSDVNRTLPNGNKDKLSEFIFYFVDKDESIRTFTAIKHLISFYKTEVKFTDNVNLEGKF